MEHLFRNKVALVTGGSSGIGRAAACAFGREGANVVVANMHPEGGLETVSIIRNSGGIAVFIKCDVTDPVEVVSLVERIITQYGRLDCAFNNAGIEGDIVRTDQCLEANWDRVLAVNLTGVWLCMKHEIRAMLRQGCGAIVNCASMAGLIGAPGVAAYSASKHGIIGLTKSAALEYAKAGLRINSVCPGPTQTPLLTRFASQYPEQYAYLVAHTPIGRVGTPDEIAEAALWLCSDKASFVTGHALVVDGGFTAQ